MALDKGSRAIYLDQIRGLHQPPTSGLFVQAREGHNNLPTDDALLQVEEVLGEHLSQLKQLFMRYNVENLFAVYILHRHFKVTKGFNLVGQIIISDKCHFYWTRPVANDTLNPGKVCGRKFILDKQHGWLPCEFHEGSAPDLSKVRQEFFLEFASYLVDNGLSSTFGLEYIVPELLVFDMLEIILPNSELLLRQVADLQRNHTLVRTTFNWSHSIFTRGTKCLPNAATGGHDEEDSHYQLQDSESRINDIIRPLQKG
ncbi:hypothetical protein Forpe1208_v017078 [Fusarium oxysporum f. sp. rapae]|uniref:Uncharacterized protein n=1 Tax=Fusarium oxysporum f. sp. rapae TaxID=485398 RepID=A0A8J5NEZ9_FUSOX|nr:hypothetical protein Forpe1208_v017161 [Fusarium oxysporum f. sp. rapae]KAG7402554.1 hypothetical protein Forpe1208_v017078 [Fusarium oxysporum f. sp. rapae]